MEYMILIHSDETQVPVPGTPACEQMTGAWMAYNQPDRRRPLDLGRQLAPTGTATTVRTSMGVAPALTDGPYAESKEQLGGFYLITATDLDQALELASAIPVPVASIEVRPVAFRPDAGAR
jgi:hypothetical protein